MAAATDVVPVSEDAEAWLRDALAAALEANRQFAAVMAELREENARLREENAKQAAELEKLRAEVAVLQRMVFGRSTEASRSGTGKDAGGGDRLGDAPGGQRRRGPGARSGRRDYSHLPRIEVVWDFPDGTYCCADCGEPFTLLGDHISGEQLDWRVQVRVVAHCRRRYKRACRCPGPATVMAPGPGKAIGKGRFSNAFIAMLLTERFVAGRSQNSLVAGLARQGAEVSAATLAGTCAQAGKLLVPLEEAIAARSRQSWHLHCDETTWRIFAPPGGDGDQKTCPATWWLWVFIGADTVCFVMDATRAASVFQRHVGIDATTGQLFPTATAAPATAQVDAAQVDAAQVDAAQVDAAAPRHLVISSDFYAVYSAAGAKADGLVNLYCWAHVRRHFVRAHDADPVQLRTWTATWLERIKQLYAAHRALMAAWQDADVATLARPNSDPALQAAYAAWDAAIDAIDQARIRQLAMPGLCQPAQKAVATLDREWDGLIRHRDYPMINLDNNIAERMIRGPVVTRKNARGSHNGDTARNAATIWTVTATAQMAGLNVLTYLTAYLDECGRGGGEPPSGADLDRFLPWTATPEDLCAWAKPPPPGRAG